MANIKNLAASFVVTPPSGTTGTSMTVTASSGTFFPAAPFYATLTPPASLSNYATAEIVLVTAVSTDTFTITRAQKSTTAQTITAGWVVTNGIYVEDITSTVAWGVTATGTVNGTNKIFTFPAFTGIELFKNGVRMSVTNDYTVTNNTTITFVTAPATGAIIVANTLIGSQTFTNGSNSFTTDEVPVGTVNGTNPTFTTAIGSYTPGSLEVFINGVKLKRTVHFTETSPSTGQFTMSDAPLTGDDVMVNYQFALGAATGNADTVDTFHANSTPTANTLLPLDSNARFPASALAGLVKKRQGGDASNWSTLGTSNQDTSALPVKIQTGVIAVTSDGMTITFPEAFTQPPIMFGNQFGNVTNNVWVRWNNSTTTTASVSTINPSGTAIFTQQISWMAIGV